MLYFGPETYLPLASILAGAAGLILTFWRRFVGFLRGIGSRIFRRRRGPRNVPDGRGG